jgi:hypothetical protein
MSYRRANMVPDLLQVSGRSVISKVADLTGWLRDLFPLTASVRIKSEERRNEKVREAQPHLTRPVARCHSI